MDASERTLERLQSLSDLLRQSPPLDPARTNWTENAPFLADLESAVTEFQSEWKKVSDFERRQGIGQLAYWDLARSAALLINAQRRSGSVLMAEAERISSGMGPLFVYGSAKPDGLLQFMMAREVWPVLRRLEHDSARLC